MPESRIAATDRLRQEGRWDDACLYRDEVKKQLRAEGAARTDANDRAWEAMQAKYPPLPPKEAVDSITDDWCVDTLPDPGRHPPDLVADTLWVYQNLARKNVQPQDAPSPGAWGLLRWARESRSRFFEQMLPKAMSASTLTEYERTRPEYDGVIPDNTLVEIRKLMLQYSGGE